jgi:hypothetical protein
MSDPEEIKLIIIEETEPADDEADRLAAAQHKTETLFHSWRSRFSTASISSSYTMSGEQVVINSGSADQAEVEYTAANGTRTVYTLGLTEGRVDLKVTRPAAPGQADAAPTKPDVFQDHEEVAWLLYACDRVEVRGRA